MCLFHTSVPFDAPVSGSRRNIADPFGMKKLEWSGVSLVKKLHDDMFSRFDRISACDYRTTDRQTDRHLATAWSALRYASRGKNYRH